RRTRGSHRSQTWKTPWGKSVSPGRPCPPLSPLPLPGVPLRVAVGRSCGRERLHPAEHARPLRNQVADVVQVEVLFTFGAVAGMQVREGQLNGRLRLAASGAGQEQPAFGRCVGRHGRVSVEGEGKEGASLPHRGGYSLPAFCRAVRLSTCLQCECLK